MKRRGYIRCITVMILSCILATSCLAVSIPNENEINDATTAIFWEYEKDYVGLSYEDEWREGPGGPGPGILGLDQGISYTQSYSGSVGGSINDINLEVGLTIGETQETTARYDL